MRRIRMRFVMMGVLLGGVIPVITPAASHPAGALMCERDLQQVCAIVLGPICRNRCG